MCQGHALLRQVKSYQVLRLNKVPDTSRAGLLLPGRSALHILPAAPYRLRRLIDGSVDRDKLSGKRTLSDRFRDSRRPGPF